MCYELSLEINHLVVITITELVLRTTEAIRNKQREQSNKESLDRLFALGKSTPNTALSWHSRLET